MIRLNPIECKKIWGYERWIASTYRTGCQKEFFDAAGGDYPLLVKIIQADETLSVQVHPDDAYAEKFEGGRGKTECWYVLDAAPDAKLVYGLNGSYSKEELAAAIAKGTLESCLNFVPVKKNDFIFIPAGTVHAIGGGLRLLEIQQSSDITYRLYDWNRGRELHVNKGLSVIQQKKIQNVLPFPGTFSCPYFSLRLFADSETESYSVPEKNISSPCDAVLLFVVDAQNFRIKSESLPEQTVLAQKEDIFAVLPGDTAVLSGEAVIMECRVKTA